ncbi:MAG: hypothetical protein LBK71_10045 [Verrucomicrobiales bacterium]|jgi:sialate O-acetylesterase|nr:hypothetical protein [Verrucomicrobiales bacterium]
MTKKLLLLLGALAVTVSGRAELKLAPVFSDHLVLQREMPAPVWGTADAGATVSVSFAGHTVSGTADDAGQWSVKLPALAADSAGQQLTVSDGKQTRTVSDVLVGEVWLCSGQSNMDFPMRGVTNTKDEIAAADRPLIRLLQVKKNTGPVPLTDPGAVWQVCTPATVADFSAVGYFFARELQQALGVPLGVINSSWGGTAIQPWIRAALFRDSDNEDFKRYYRWRADRIKDTVAEDNALLADVAAKLDAWQAKIAALIAKHGDYPPTLPADGWTKVTAPGNLEAAAPRRADGVWLLRKTFHLDPDLIGAGTLQLGQIWDYDIAWLNGTRVGATLDPANRDARNQRRQYAVPAGVLRPGDNELLIRVFNRRGDVHIGHGAPSFGITLTGGAPVLLNGGDWQLRLEEPLDGLCPPDHGENRQSNVGVLYDNMIAPLVPFALRGAIWYQGESNAGRPEEYGVLLPLLIDNWRQDWHQPALSFYIVQLANFMARAEQPTDTNWARLREAQLRTALTVPHTGLAVTIDIGDAGDIHPRNKQDVGRRLALNALAKDYGRPVEYRGPSYRDLKIDGNKIVLRFDHLGQGLVNHNPDGALRGFAIAGADRKFVWATATISGDTVILSADGVASPVAARYAWADNPAADLYNADGLPASPFRTDDWER